MNIRPIIDSVLNTENSAFFYTPAIYRGGKSYHFSGNGNVMTANDPKSINQLLLKADELINIGKSFYSLINYEAGFSFEEKLNSKLQPATEVARLVFFEPEKVSVIPSSTIRFEYNFSDNKYSINNFKLNSSRDKYSSDLEKIKRYIEAGDTYQVNYTVKGSFDFFGDAGSLFLHLIFNQSAKYAALINCGSGIIISLSPELFFEKDGDNILSRPMKGTSVRGNDVQEDQLKKYLLQNSVKNRAENVMIVDLIRNDFGRICEFSSVKVSGLFEVETYESLLQMVSTVKGRLKEDVMLSDIIKNIFPCGSITGAPKIRTMEIIDELETQSRGIYTGTVGFVHGNKTAFNVAIRTIEIVKKSCQGNIGIGSGIVWDSDIDNEYEETLLKSRFLTEPQPHFFIFETMRVADKEILLIEEHLSRLESSSNYFLFKFNRKSVKNKIRKRINKLADNSAYKLKLQLFKNGETKISVTPFKELKSEVRIIISTSRIYSHDKFRHHKTSLRDLYDKEYRHYYAKEFYEVIYLNESGNVSEGSITNIFIRIGDIWLTPPLSSGALPGVFRKVLLAENPLISERNFSVEDLLAADEVILTNALRGKITVDTIYPNENQFVSLRERAGVR